MSLVLARARAVSFQKPYIGPTRVVKLKYPWCYRVGEEYEVERKDG